MTQTYAQQEQEVFAVAENPFIKDKEVFLTSRNRWLPLWLYICGVNEEICNKHFGRNVPFNKSLIFTESESIEMAKKLKEMLENGDFIYFCEQWNDTHGDKFSVEKKDLEDFIEFCGFSGGFSL